jgi:hypothetical protein
MKKLFVIAIAGCLLLSSCGTILGGKISECQKTKPTDGTHRKVRIVAFLFDGPWGWIIDFSDGAMYKPCADKK